MSVGSREITFTEYLLHAKHWALRTRDSHPHMLEVETNKEMREFTSR